MRNLGMAVAVTGLVLVLLIIGLVITPGSDSGILVMFSAALVLMLAGIWRLLSRGDRSDLR